VTRKKRYAAFSQVNKRARQCWHSVTFFLRGLT
jgi:hypothetical protein